MVTQGVTLGIKQTQKPKKQAAGTSAQPEWLGRKEGLAKLRRKFRCSHGYHLGVVANG